MPQFRRLGLSVNWAAENLKIARDFETFWVFFTFVLYKFLQLCYNQVVIVACRSLDISLVLFMPKEGK